jgi:hypothetical protein
MKTCTFLLAVLALTSASNVAFAEDDEPGGAKYPEYVVGGAISLVAAGGLAVGGAVATFDDSPQSAIGLLGLGTVAAGVGVPLVLLGAADEQPVSTQSMATGVAIATPGVISLGIGGTMWAAQAASQDDLQLGLPLTLLIGGAAATVTGVVVYATGAGHDDSADAVRAEVKLGPTGASFIGTF